MKYKEIEINGDIYPVNFGSMAVGEFLDSQGLSLMGLEKLGGNLSLLQGVKLFYYTLKHGARVTKADFQLSEVDAADLLDSFPGGWTEGLTKVMELFADSMPQGNEKKVTAAGGRKKKRA